MTIQTNKLKLPDKVDIEIILPELHLGQKAVLAACKRFNVIRCGRRWGKTVLGIDLAIDPALDGWPVAILTPSYADSDELWEEIVETLDDLIEKKNESKRRILLKGGGKIHFYSFEKPNRMRGKKYKRVIIDEAAFCKNLLDVWQKVIRPTLTDYKGDAWFLSTPIIDSDFQILDEYSKTRKTWASFHAPSSSNPALDPRELEDIYADLPEDVVDQEYKALYVNFHGKNFCQYWSDDHIYHGPIEDLIDKDEDLYLCFDFNIANTVLVIQSGKYWCNVLKEYHADAFDLETLCTQLKADWPDYKFIINGDASGSSGSAFSKDNKSAYELMKVHLRIRYEQIHVPKKNPAHRSSYVHCNAFWKNAKWLIHESCVELITDFKKVKITTEKGKFEIDKKDERRTHWLDPYRYHVRAEHEYILLNAKSDEDVD